MARSSTTTEEFVDSASVILWTFVKGEQLELPVRINFVEEADAGYTYEAVVIEGLNTITNEEVPTTHKPGGIQTTLSVRVPAYQGEWQATVAFNKEHIVKYNNVYYRLLAGAGRVSNIAPPLDPFWAETTRNIIYIQFPRTLATNWEFQPKVNIPTYGFFELRVTEPEDAIFQRTWKPVRGTVRILFSPTDEVPDV